MACCYEPPGIASFTCGGGGRGGERNAEVRRLPKFGTAQDSTGEDVFTQDRGKTVKDAISEGSVAARGRRGGEKEMGFGRRHLALVLTLTGSVKLADP